MLRKRDTDTHTEREREKKPFTPGIDTLSFKPNKRPKLSHSHATGLLQGQTLQLLQHLRFQQKLEVYNIFHTVHCKNETHTNLPFRMIM